MEQELAVLAAFFLLQATFHKIHGMHNRVCSKVLEKVVHSSLGVAIFHPAIIHTIQDYSVHFVVYSGKVIGAH